MSSNLQNKLLAFQTPPSPEVWNQLKAKLDEETPLSRKLQLYEQTPPVFIWKKITENLDGANARVIPFYRRYHKPLKYSGAIAAFISIAIITSLLIGKKTRSEERPLNITTNLGLTPKRSVNENVGNDNISSNRKKGNYTPIFVRETKAIEHVLNTEAGKPLAQASRFLPKVATFKNLPLNPDDHYLVYSNDNGDALRMPKKLYEVIFCPSTDQNCREHLHQLQARIVSNAMASDFTGVLDILNNLGENQ